MLQLSNLREGEAQTAPAEWIAGLIGTASELSSTASSGTSAEAEASVNAPANSSESACINQRVVLGPKLAVRLGQWEEGAPEDLVPALQRSAALVIAVMDTVSSRVKPRCAQALTTLSDHSVRAATILSATAVIPKAGIMKTGGGLIATVPVDTVSRSVNTAVITALECLLDTLLHPSVFAPVSCTSKTCATPLHTLIKSASIGNDTSFSLCILDTIVGKFDRDVCIMLMELHLTDQVFFYFLTILCVDFLIFLFNPIIAP